jgi:hypothetical protein
MGRKSESAAAAALSLFSSFQRKLESLFSTQAVPKALRFQLSLE